MLKARSDGKKPSQFSTTEVRREVTAKFRRAAAVNVIAICANDHRAAHFSAEKEKLALKMRSILVNKLRQASRFR